MNNHFDIDAVIAEVEALLKEWKLSYWLKRLDNIKAYIEEMRKELADQKHKYLEAIESRRQELKDSGKL